MTWQAFTLSVSYFLELSHPHQQPTQITTQCKGQATEHAVNQTVSEDVIHTMCTALPAQPSLCPCKGHVAWGSKISIVCVWVWKVVGGAWIHPRYALGLSQKRTESEKEDWDDLQLPIQIPGDWSSCAKLTMSPYPLASRWAGVMGRTAEGGGWDERAIGVFILPISSSPGPSLTMVHSSNPRLSSCQSSLSS